MSTSKTYKKPLVSKYAGKCARTGAAYGPGTKLSKNADGKWEIAPGCEPVLSLRVRFEDGTVQPLIYGERALYCRCVKEQPGFDEKKVAASKGTLYPERVLKLEGDAQAGALGCAGCGRRLEVVAPEKVERAPAETKQCWECGSTVTYAQVKRNGGDWNEDVCGAGSCYCGC